MSPDTHIEKARAEALGVIHSIDGYTARQRSAQQQRASRLFAIVAQARADGNRQAADKALNSVIRQIHNSYGWKALGAVEKNGVCAGALYRSERYLAIPSEDRSGARHDQNVHIEHTVKVASLIRAVHRQHSAAPVPLYDFLIRHSVCTAMTMDEKAAVDSARCTGVDGSGVVQLFPFARYSKASATDRTFRIVNVLSGCVIDLHSFTFGDHVQVLEQAMAAVNGSGKRYFLQ